MVGNGWSPDQAGGLNRYVSNLTHAIDELGLDQTVLVLGAAETTPSDSLRLVSATAQPLPVRLQGFRREIKQQVAGTDVVVSHFALNVVPLFLRRGPRPPLVVHFHGPWAAESRAMGEARPVVALKEKMDGSSTVEQPGSSLSAAFRDILISDYGIAPAKISVVGPGVDAGGFRRVAGVCRRQRALPVGRSCASAASSRGWGSTCCSRRGHRRASRTAIWSSWVTARTGRS